MKLTKFQTEAIEINSFTNKCGTDEDGSILTFIGQARNKSKGKEVEYLEYELFNSMAITELNKIVDFAISKWELTDCIVIHRYGKVKISEGTIFIAVSSPHRDASYQASRYIIDTIKETVPIWKKEFYNDGSHWIGSGS